MTSDALSSFPFPHHHQMPHAGPKPSLQIHYRAVTGGGGGKPSASAQVVRCAGHGIPDAIACHHEHAVGPHQCCSVAVQYVAAPPPRRVASPQLFAPPPLAGGLGGPRGPAGTRDKLRRASEFSETALMN